MIRALFKDVKIGGLFTDTEGFQFYRKLNNKEAVLVRMGTDGRLRTVRKLSTYWMYPTDVVHFNSWNEHNANVKYAGKRTNKQTEALVRFRALGDLARTKQNLQIIGNQHSQRLNVMQLKKLEEARMIIGWLDKQVRHEMAVAKALNKQQKQVAA